MATTKMTLPNFRSVYETLRTVEDNQELEGFYMKFALAVEGETLLMRDVLDLWVDAINETEMRIDLKRAVFDNTESYVRKLFFKRSNDGPYFTKNTIGIWNSEYRDDVELVDNYGRKRETEPTEEEVEVRQKLASVNFENYTINELREIASHYEINLEGDHRKSDLVEHIREHFEGNVIEFKDSDVFGSDSEPE